MILAEYRNCYTRSIGQDKSSTHEALWGGLGPAETMEGSVSRVVGTAWTVTRGGPCRERVIIGFMAAAGRWGGGCTVTGVVKL